MKILLKVLEDELFFVPTSEFLVLLPCCFTSRSVRSVLCWKVLIISRVDGEIPGFLGDTVSLAMSD